MPGGGGRIPEVASADVALGEIGLDEVIRALDRFSEKVESSMRAAEAATEAATQVSKSSIVAFGALGAAMGTVFVDFIRQSSVMSTLGSAFGAIFGSVADRILLNLLPSIVKLIPKLLDMGDTFVEVSGRIIDDLLPAFDKAIEGAGEVGVAFAGLDDETQTLLVSIGLLLGGFGLIASGRPVLGAGAVISAFAIHIEGITQTINESGQQLLDYAHIVQMLPARFEEEFGRIAGHLNDFAGFINDFAHDFQLWSIGLGISAALGVLAIRDAWDGLVGWFEDLWRSLAGGAETAWGSFAAVMTGAWDVVVGSFRTFVNAMAGLLVGFINPFVQGINAMASAINAVAGVLLLPTIPLLPELSIPSLQRGAEILEPGLAFVHRKEVVLPASLGATVAPLPASMAVGGGTTQHIEFHGATYHINSPIPTDAGQMAAFKRMLDQHSREDAERLMSKLRRRL